MDRFWMCFAEHGQSPRAQHMSLIEAKAEAERILQVNQGKGTTGVVFVLEAVEAVYVPAYPVSWEKLE